MQMDLLQKDMFPVVHDSPSAPRKPPALAQSASKKSTLPKSLTPPFTSDDYDCGEVYDKRSVKAPVEKSSEAFKNINEAAKFLGVPQHVLRFWESRFAQIKPLKLAGGRRYYRPEDMDVLVTIKNLLYKQGYTIKGAKKAFSMRKHAPAAPVENTLPESHQIAQPAKKRVLTDKQKSQLAVLRQELSELRAQLKVYI